MKSSWMFTAPLLGFLAVFAGAHFGSQWAGRLFWTSGISLVNDPPWYSIGQDFVYGLFCLGGMIVTLVLAVSTRRRFGTGSWMAAWMAVIWMGYPAAQAFLILARTTRIWDPSAALSQWRGFHEYTTDPARDLIFALSLIVGFVFAIRTRRYFEAPSTEEMR